MCVFLEQKGDSPADAIDNNLLSQLSSRPWHGNIRELRNAIFHAAVLAGYRPLELSDFPPMHEPPSASGKSAALDDAVAHWAQVSLTEGCKNGGLHAQFLAASEPTLLKMAIQKTGGNRLKAAELLGIHRGTLRDKLRQYGLED